MDLEFLGIDKQTQAKDEKKIIHQQEKNKGYAKSVKFYLKEQKQVKNIKELIGHLPKENEIINILSNSQFNAFTFIPFVLSQAKIEEVSVITYSITTKVIDSLVNLVLEKEIEKLNLFLSDHLLSMRKEISHKLFKIHDRQDGLYKNINIGFTFSHAKITVMDDYIISGSGNMNMNSRLEQYFFIKSKEIRDFFMNNFFNNFSITEADRERAR